MIFKNHSLRKRTLGKAELCKKKMKKKLTLTFRKKNDPFVSSRLMPLAI